MSDSSTFLPVPAAYDRWAGSYDNDENPMVFAARRAMAGLAAAAAGLDVVEFGCGTGQNLSLLRRHGARSLRGCDLSAGMLAQARARDPALQLWRQDMAQPLPLADATADLALFSLSLEHVAALAPPLAEARRLLRPGGRLAVLEIHPYLTLGGIGAHFRDATGEVRMPSFPHGFADYLNTFAALDLRLLRCREWRPRDLGDGLPPKVLKRGPDFPLLVEFALTRE
ncbi:class I SAM-dependent methyltransferase [Roseomonas sp. M0104]|uniref:Class I SAM-dependent methyltransferase n=1 Tax=Teichococcus coralli TaxID=2545983 RepID=A0A845BLC7_9PROT|nr:class I SAM-dependent methyltransferase [Pseudoroseomonas coralli]MXP64209.1 class I SAM-dependent methyltransferase [Pseudoroseomonas coralli]